MLERFRRFLDKPSGEKISAGRFLFRQNLAKLPYMPVLVRLTIPTGNVERFWWSYVVPTFHADRGFFDYWGDDVGELRFMWRFLRPPMVFFDVGAYHGLYAIVAARRLGNEGRVIAFEPSPREQRRLRLHLRLNRMSQVQLKPCAVSSCNGRQRFFFVASADTTMNSLRPPAIEGAIEETAVEVTSLDSFCHLNDIPHVDLMKIDVEGGELDVFRGAQRVLVAHRPVIICEALDRVTQPWGYRAREIVCALKRHNYQWFSFRAEGTLRPHAEREDYPEVRNYLAVPREKLGSIQEWVQP